MRTIGDFAAAGPRAAAEHALARLAALDGTLGAFLETFADRAREHAEWQQARRASGGGAGGVAGAALWGVPIAVKDNICIGPDLAQRTRPEDKPDGRGFGGRTTCASRMLENYRSPFTATAVQRLLDAGAVPIGKTNLDEFAMGSSTEHSAFGVTRNPWDHSRVPGGSSGGSAAAVAAGIVPLALGSDTGGSIRQPAAYCGVVGLKPTYGRISRFGLVAYASSLDQIGVITTDVADAAAALTLLCGRDDRDATSVEREAEDFGRELSEPVAGLTIAVPRQCRTGSNHPAVGAALERAAEALRAQGARIVDADMPLMDAAIAAYYIIATAEASSNLARYDGVRYGRRAELRQGEGLHDLYARSRTEGFGAEVRRRIMLGTHVLSAGYADAYYLTALKVRRRIRDEYTGVFGSAPGADAILLPTAPTPAFAIGAKTADPLTMYLEDVYTVGVNLAGLPAMSVPAGFAEEAGRLLPVGVQVVAPAFREARMLRIGAAIERAIGKSPPPPAG